MITNKSAQYQTVPIEIREIVCHAVGISLACHIFSAEGPYKVTECLPTLEMDDRDE